MKQKLFTVWTKKRSKIKFNKKNSRWTPLYNWRNTCAKDCTFVSHHISLGHETIDQTNWKGIKKKSKYRFVDFVKYETEKYQQKKEMCVYLFLAAKKSVALRQFIRFLSSLYQLYWPLFSRCMSICLAANNFKFFFRFISMCVDWEKKTIRQPKKQLKMMAKRDILGKRQTKNEI